MCISGILFFNYCCCFSFHSGLQSKRKMGKKKVVWALIGYWEPDGQQLTDKKGFVPSWFSKSSTFFQRRPGVTVGWQLRQEVSHSGVIKLHGRGWHNFSQQASLETSKGTKSSQILPEPQCGRSCWPAADARSKPLLLLGAGIVLHPLRAECTFQNPRVMGRVGLVSGEGTLGGCHSQRNSPYKVLV